MRQDRAGGVPSKASSDQLDRSAGNASGQGRRIWLEFIRPNAHPLELTTKGRPVLMGLSIRPGNSTGRYSACGSPVCRADFAVSTIRSSPPPGRIVSPSRK